MKLIKIDTALKSLKKLNEEIRYADCFTEKQFTAGLIAFGRARNQIRNKSTMPTKTSSATSSKAAAACGSTGNAFR